jgi:dephospho-CoA kinase
MFKVGITGGIGSGKSTVARIFEVLGIPVYYADEAAKQLMNTDPVIRKGIIREFGEEAYKNGMLDRKYLALQVFNNEEKLSKLNALIHPQTIADAESWAEAQQSPYTLKEAALIFESGSQNKLDFIIGVYAPAALRIKRTMHRDGISREEVIARMNKQIEENIKMRLCDAVIMNDDRHMVIPQVLQLHELLLQKARSVLSDKL